MKYLIILFFFFVLSVCTFSQGLGLYNSIGTSSLIAPSAPSPPAPPPGFLYFITADGDTFFTVEGDTFYVPMSFNDGLLQIKERNRDEKVFICYNYVYAIMRKQFSISTRVYI